MTGNNGRSQLRPREERRAVSTGERRLGLASMLRLDFYRLVHTPALYVMLLIAAMIPALMAMGGSDASTGASSGIAITNTWQLVESLGESAAGENPLDMGAYANINMVFIFAGLLMAIFIAHDYSSGFVKNIFCVHARKCDYVISKLAVGVTGGVGMLATYVIGACLSGWTSGASFSVDVSGLVFCLISKALLMFAFCGLFLCIAVFFKHDLWVTIVFTFLFGMMLYPAGSVATLASTPVTVLVAAIAGALAAAAFGSVATLVLSRRDVV